MSKNIVIFICLIFGVWAFDQSKYPNSAVLSPYYSIFWKVNEANNEIALAIKAQTTGWLGFGIGEPTSGSMPGADIMIAFVEGTSQKVVLSDRYGLDYVEPSIDGCQDWKLVSGSEKGGITIVEVTRALNLNTSEDRSILPGLNKIIYAVGTSDVVSYHGGTRGASSIKFFGPEVVSTINETDIQTIEFHMDALIPPQFTTYMCQSFDLPPLSDGSILKFEPLISAGPSSAMTHHMIVHGCVDNTNTSYVSTYRTAGECASPVGASSAQCVMIGFIWSVGTASLEMPPGVGLRIGNATDYSFTHIVIEFHYTNPAGILNVRDDSGVRITFTPTKRPIDMGVLTLGDPLVTFPDIPALTRNFALEASCPSACTSQWPHGITVFADFLHMHAAGSRIFTNQFRNETYVRTTNRIDYYSYGFQELSPSAYEILPGDRLNTHCVFDTTTRSKATQFGPGSLDEMCMEFLWYYPVLFQPQTNTSITMCGHVFAGPDFGAITVCGNNNFSISVLPLKNPDILDSISGYTKNFGIADTKCTKDVLTASATALSLSLIFIIQVVLISMLI